MQEQKTKAKKAEFPLDIRRGSVVVRIYQTKNRGSILYTLTHRGPGGHRIRENFADLERAKARGEEVATRILNGQSEVLELGNTDRAIYLRARELLAPLGKDMDVAIAEYVDATTTLKGSGTLSDAARFYARHYAAIVNRKYIPQIYEEFLEAKKVDGAGSRYLQECKYRLKKFSDAFPGLISECTTAEMQKWLVALEGSPRSRNNMRRMVVTIFNFARDRGYLPKERQTEADSLSEAKAAPTKIGILEPDEMEKLLANAESSLVPYLAIGGFAGLRQAELMRLEWADIKLAEGHILVDAEKAKTGQRRLVPIQPNLARWLRPYSARSGLLYESSRTLGKVTAFAKGLEIPWPHNALRHSYASYRLAACKNAAEVAHEMGNSPQMVYQHYRELVTPASATKWWGIKPKKPHRQ